MLSSILSTPKVVLAGGIINFISCYVIAGYVPIVPFLVSDRHQVGILLSAQGLGSCISLVPIGLLVDKFGAQPMLEFGTFLVGVGAALTSLPATVAPVFLMQLFARLVVGVATGATFNAGMALVMERYQSAKRTEYIGVTLALTTLGNIVGPIAAGQIFTAAETAGLPAPQAWAFCPAYIFLAVGYFMLEPAPTNSLKVPLNKAEEKIIAEDSRNSNSAPVCKPANASGKPSAWRHVFQLFFGVYAAVGVRALVLAIALAYLFAAMQAEVCAAALVLKGMGYNAGKIALICSPAAIVQVILNPWAGRQAAEAYKRELLMLSGPLILAVLLIGAVVLPEFDPQNMVPAILLGIASSSAAVSICDAPSISMMSDLATMHGRGYGEAVTASELAVTAGQGFGPVFGVFVLQQYGFQYLCMMLAGCAVFVSIVSILFLRNIPHLTEGGDSEDEQAERMHA